MNCSECAVESCVWYGAINHLVCEEGFVQKEPPTSEAPVDILVSRDEFEKWCEINGYKNMRDGMGNYWNPETAIMWIAWQACWSLLKKD